MNITYFLLPMIVLLIIFYAFINKHNIYDSFIKGCGEGLNIGIKLFPYLFSMILAVNIFISSDLLSHLFSLLKPISSFIKAPIEVLPMYILRPISSSASLAYVTNIFTNYGVDSLLGNLVSTIQGSTDTTIYILTIYFGSIGIKKIRYALKVGLIADIIGITLSIILVIMMLK